MTKEIPLTRGKFALVDDEDYEWLMQWKWHCNGSNGYAARTERVGDKRKTVVMHRVITGAPEGMDVDHKNSKRCDNRRENLRVCTTSENCWNSKPRGKYKSVTYHSWGPGGAWRARITVGKKLLHLGMHSTEEQAARAYDEAAKIHYGEFAWLNFPEKGNG